MKDEQDSGRDRRAQAFAALGDPVRLAIVERLALSDAVPSDLSSHLEIGSNLLAHHLNVLESAGLVRRLRSEGDGRRTYVQLMPESVPVVAGATMATPQRLLFVCTANSARSQLATLLWQAVSDLPAESAGTHPAVAVAPGAIATAQRHGLRLAARTRPRDLDAVKQPGDLLITVCDRAHEELADASALHWSVPDPVPAGSDHAFETAFRDLDHRVHGLAQRLTVAS